MNIPNLLEAAAVLATFVHWHAIPAQSHSSSMFMGIHSLAAYLQLQAIWV
ncbi:rNA polymerase sigma-70 factor, ECF subfamily [Vibrio vulnificus]|nr:rNA polymerase sigma-70 factor, ECF subfamily [Vibrio vulnificus]